MPGDNFGLIDNLTQHYNGNQLFQVNDTRYKGSSSITEYVDGYVNNDIREFIYDQNGRLVTDLDRGISTIRYNYLHLPDTIQFRNGNAIYYTYDALGVKRKIDYITVKSNLLTPIVVETGKIRPLQSSERLSWLVTEYCGNFVYEGDHIGNWLFPGGYGLLDGMEEEIETFLFYNQDYLGNNRDVVRKKSNVLTTVQRTEYYAFGTPFEQQVGDEGAQRYKFTGKEFDSMHGLHYYDHGARMYDPLLIRWHLPDPLAEKYYSISPYAYCLNNPIKYVDPDGEIPILSGLVGFFRGLGGGINGGLQTAWKTERNAWKLLGGLFTADKNKNLGGKIGQIFSRLTWELPQTLGGYLTGSIANMAYDSDVSFYAGATITRINNQIFGGVTLGSYILGDYKIMADPSETLFQHEFGHVLQSRIYGPSYIFAIGVPSLFSASTNSYEEHMNQWFEQDANKRSLEYWKKGGISVKWNYRTNPINSFNTYIFERESFVPQKMDGRFLFFPLTEDRVMWRYTNDYGTD